MVSNLIAGLLGAVLGAALWNWILLSPDEEGQETESETFSELRAENEKFKKALSFERSCLHYLRMEKEGLMFEHNCNVDSRRSAEQEVERLSALLKEEQQESYKKDQRIVELQLQSVKLSRELLEEVKKNK